MDSSGDKEKNQGGERLAAIERATLNPMEARICRNEFYFKEISECAFFKLMTTEGHAHGRPRLSPVTNAI